MAPDIEISRFSIRYISGTAQAISDLSLKVRAGTCCAVLGPTGSGKTTLLLSLAGSLGTHVPMASAAGEIRIGTEAYHPLPASVLFPRTAFALEDSHLQLSGVCETVEDEVAFSLYNLGRGPDEARTIVSGMLEFFGLTPLAHRHPLSLSGGELRRVLLASLLAVEPELLLLDEPAAGLDSDIAHRLARLVRSMKGTRTVMFADSGINLALAAADSFAVLDRGSLVFSGDRSMFLKNLPRFGPLLPVERWIQVSGAATETRPGERMLRPSISRLAQGL